MGHRKKTQNWSSKSTARKRKMRDKYKHGNRQSARLAVLTVKQRKLADGAKTGRRTYRQQLRRQKHLKNDMHGTEWILYGSFHCLQVVKSR